MFHPGKVLEVLNPENKLVKSSDSSVQAVVEMWDQNILTLSVSEGLRSSIKNGQTVIVDYGPTSEHLAVPKHIVVKILDKTLGKKVLELYSKFYDKKKQMMSENTEKPLLNNPFAR